MAKLGELLEQYQTNEEAAVEFAYGLGNLSFAQTKEDDIQESIRQSKNLFVKYPQNTEIQLSYAVTQFCLTLKQAPDALRQTVMQLRTFLQAHPDANQEFQDDLDTYLSEHPDHEERYTPLRL